MLNGKYDPSKSDLLEDGLHLQSLSFTSNNVPSCECDSAFSLERIVQRIRAEAALLRERILTTHMLTGFSYV